MSLVGTLHQCREPCPDCLHQLPPTFDRSAFFSSRTVYYPGFGDDGQPVKLCAQAHAAHAFVYVDYGVSQQTIRDHLSWIGGDGFRGYTVEHEQEVSESDLRPGGWKPHVDLSELPEEFYRFVDVIPYAMFVVLKRDDDHDDSHGPMRLAILFIGGDGYATYDALYCQPDGTSPPFLVVIEDYGFGGNTDQFAAGGLLEKIALRSGVFPKCLLVGKGKKGPFEPWSGYRDSGAAPEPGGMHGHPRRLFCRDDSAG